MLPLSLLLSAALASAPVPAPAAHAAPVSAAPGEPDVPGIDFHAWAEGGWLVTDGDHTDGVEQRPFLSMARISSRTDHTLSRYNAAEHVGSFLQLEGKNGTVELLDARVELDLRHGVHLRAGRFKTAVSNEFLVPAMKMLTARRPHYVDVTPQRRTGVEVDLRPSVDDGHINVQLGAFGADDPWALGEETGDDALLTARVRHIGESHLLLHAGFMERTGLSEPELEAREHVRRELDLAAGLERDDAQVVFEGIVADRGAGLGAPTYGGGVTVGRRFGELKGEKLAFEPVFAADALVDGDAHEICEDVGLNVFWDGWNLVQRTQVTFFQTDEGNHWVASAQLRGGF